MIVSFPNTDVIKLHNNMVAYWFANDGNNITEPHIIEAVWAVFMKHREWCKENGIEYSLKYVNEEIQFDFIHNADAVQFKLKWA